MLDITHYKDTLLDFEHYASASSLSHLRAPIQRPFSPSADAGIYLEESF